MNFPGLSLASTPPDAQRTDRRVLINMGALSMSSLWRILLSFGLQLWIANRLGATGLGQYTAALAYLNVCQVLSELGLPQLLVRDLAHRPEQRAASFRMALLLQIGAAFAIWLAMIGLTWVLPYQPSTRTALILITASLPFYAVSSVCLTMFQSGERMELVMGIELIINTLIIASSIVVLWLGGDVVHLAAVIIGTQFISALLCLWLLRKSRLLTTDSAPNSKPHPWSIGRVRKFWQSARPFYGLALANVLLHRLDILLLSVVAGETVTGIYSAAYLVVRVFVVLVQNYWQALYPTLSRLRQQTSERYTQLLNLGVRYGIIILLLIAVVGSNLSDLLLGLVYRQVLYTQAAAAFQLLIWIVPLYFISTYAVHLLLIERKPAHSLLITSLHLGAMSLLLPWLAAEYGAWGAALAVLIAITVSASTGLWLLYHQGIPIPLRKQWLLPVAVILSVLVLQAGRLFLPTAYWPLVLAVTVLFYAAVLWVLKVIAAHDLRLFVNALRP